MKTVKKNAKCGQKIIKSVVFTLGIAASLPCFISVFCLSCTYAAQAKDSVYTGTKVRIDFGNWKFVESGDSPSVLDTKFLGSLNIDKNSVKSICIPASVSSIEAKCFHGLSSLESVMIAPKSNLEYIGPEVFLGCIKLNSFQIKNANKLKIIGKSAFASCKGLQSLTIVSSVTEMGTFVFSGCSNLETVIFEKGSKIKKLQSRTFLNCRSLNKVSLPQYLQEIDEAAFSGCSSLVGLEIPTRVTVIAPHAFANCKKLAYIKLPPNLKTIGTMALADTALESIVIPASVEEIGIGAFFTSYKLKKIQFRSYSNWWGNCASLYLSRNMQDGSVITFADDGSMLRFTKADDWHVVDDVEPMAPENDDFDEDTVSTQEATSWLTIKNVCWAGVATAFLCYATFFLYKKGLRAVFRLEKIPSTTLWRINFRSFYRTQKKVVFCTF